MLKGILRNPASKKAAMVGLVAGVVVALVVVAKTEILNPVIEKIRSIGG